MTAPAFTADYYDGVSSTRRAVQVAREGASVRIEGDGVNVTLGVSDVRVQPRIGRTPLRMLLPGNALLVAPAEAVAAVLEIPRGRGLAHRLESHLGVVVASLAGVVACGWLAVQFGVPWAAERIAMHIPPAVERDIAEQGLAHLDALVLKPTTLPAARQAQVRALFAQLRDHTHGAASAARLEFRDGGWVGPNALAIPGGVVIVTDQLLALMDKDDQVAAVLAHELGHLEHRHGSRQILQGSMVALIAAAFAGDASTATSVVVGAPTVLIHNGYSREFEREADRYSYGLLRATGRSPRALGDALSRLRDALAAPAAERGPQGAKKDATRRRASIEAGYLSTHPGFAERIRDAEEAGR